MRLRRACSDAFVPFPALAGCQPDPNFDQIFDMAKGDRSQGQMGYSARSAKTSRRFAEKKITKYNIKIMDPRPSVSIHVPP